MNDTNVHGTLQQGKYDDSSTTEHNPCLRSLLSKGPNVFVVLGEFRGDVISAWLNTRFGVPRNGQGEELRTASMFEHHPRGSGALKNSSVRWIRGISAPHSS